MLQYLLTRWVCLFKGALVWAGHKGADVRRDPERRERAAPLLQVGRLRAVRAAAVKGMVGVGKHSYIIE